MAAGGLVGSLAAHIATKDQAKRSTVERMTCIWT